MIISSIVHVDSTWSSMSGHRIGEKIASSHSTVIPIAEKVVDMARKLPEVTKISPGIILSGISTPRFGTRVKITSITGGALLTVRGTRAIQEIRVYSTDIPKTILDLAKAIRDADIAINFK